MKYIPFSQRNKKSTFTGKSGNIDDIMDRIASVESAGTIDPYKALGPVVENGMYAGERALGKYQVMPGNIPSWSKEALGYEITPEQFLESPELQEKITRHQMKKNLVKYGNADDVASVWFTGRPVEKAQGAKDVTGTDVTEYLRRFNSTTNDTEDTGLKYIPFAQRKSKLYGF